MVIAVSCPMRSGPCYYSEKYGRPHVAYTDDRHRRSALHVYAAYGAGQRYPALEPDHGDDFKFSTLSPAGKDSWGPNQTLNDRDKEVDHDERLRITGVEPGRYDAKVGYRDSRQCVVKDIEIKADAVFSIADKDLKNCNK
jgi:hypothetical protein